MQQASKSSLSISFSTFSNRDPAMGFFRRSAHDASQVDGTPPSYDASNDAASGQILSGKGDLKFTVEQGGNGSMPSYQEVSGAPVETISSLGYAVGPVTIIFMNISQMVGTGVYSTRASSSLFISFYLLLTFPSGDDSQRCGLGRAELDLLGPRIIYFSHDIECLS